MDEFFKTSDKSNILFLELDPNSDWTKAKGNNFTSFSWSYKQCNTLIFLWALDEGKNNSGKSNRYPNFPLIPTDTFLQHVCRWKEFREGIQRLSWHQFAISPFQFDFLTITIKKEKNWKLPVPCFFVFAWLEFLSYFRWQIFHQWIFSHSDDNHIKFSQNTNHFYEKS